MTGSRKYLVLFAAVAILSAVVIVWITFNPLDPLAIPPGETRGRVSVCFGYFGASAAAFRVTIDGVERANVTIGRRTTTCVYPLVDPGTHDVSIYCHDVNVGSSRMWSKTVDLSSREVVQLPAAGQSYSCS